MTDDTVTALVHRILKRLPDDEVMLSDETMELGRQLWTAVGGGTRDIPPEAFLALGYLHWYRYLLLPADTDTNDLETALVFLSKVEEHAPDRIRALIAERTAIDDEKTLWLERTAEVVTAARHTEDVAVAHLAVDMARRGRTWLLEEGQGRALLQQFLAVALTTRFDRTHYRADLDASIVAARAVIPGASAWSNLGSALLIRYKADGEENDLLEAIDCARAALAESSDDDPELSRYLSNLSGQLVNLYRIRGTAALIDEAVDTARRAVRLAPGDPHYALGNLGAALRARYRAFGRSGDLDEAITTIRTAIEICDQDHPNRRVHLANLVDLLTSRHDYEEAIAVGKPLLAETPVGHPARAQVVMNVGLALRSHGTDLDRAAALEREALETLNRTHPRWPDIAANVAYSLVEQSIDLDKAMDLASESVRATAAGDPSLGWRIQVLAIALETRAKRDGRSADRAKALVAWQKSSAIRTAPIRIRLQSAIRGAEWAMSQLGDDTQALAGFTTAVGLLDRLAWRGLDRADRETLLAAWTGLAGAATAVALRTGDPEAALELAEQGRAVLWSQLLADRTATRVLRDVAPGLFDRLTEITAELA